MFREPRKVPQHVRIYNPLQTLQQPVNALIMFDDIKQRLIWFADFNSFSASGKTQKTANSRF
jgi:hypothetical protein